MVASTEGLPIWKFLRIHFSSALMIQRNQKFQRGGNGNCKISTKKKKRETSLESQTGTTPDESSSTVGSNGSASKLETNNKEFNKTLNKGLNRAASARSKNSSRRESLSSKLTYTNNNLNHPSIIKLSKSNNDISSTSPKPSDRRAMTKASLSPRPTSTIVRGKNASRSGLSSRSKGKGNSKKTARLVSSTAATEKVDTQEPDPSGAVAGSNSNSGQSTPVKKPSWAFNNRKESVIRPLTAAKTIKEIFRIDLNELRRQREKEGKPVNYANRVIYARNAAEFRDSATVHEGEKIDLETASKLKELVWGSPNMPPKPEWMKQGILFHQYDQIFAYGLKCPNNGAKNFILCFQAYLLKQLLFDKKAKPGSLRAQLMTPNERVQNEMFINGLAELLIKLAAGGEAVLCLKGPENCFDPTAHFAIDGITEKLRLLKSKSEEEMKAHVKRFSSIFYDKDGIGLLLILYSFVLSRHPDRVLSDLQDHSTNALIDPMGECTVPLLNLVITGKATPYFHNGIISAAQDANDTDSRDIVGIEQRNDIGFLIWDTNEEKTFEHNLGSRLKTPIMPIWVTRCNEKIGVLFNPSRELMRSYHAENRFQLYYYSDFDFKKEAKTQTILTIDTRNIQKSCFDDTAIDTEFEEVQIPVLQKVIQTKWEGCTIDWNGAIPHV